MEGLLTAILRPLFEVNPIGYVSSSSYRARVEGKLGRRARRVFCYQMFVATMMGMLLLFLFLGDR